MNFYAFSGKSAIQLVKCTHTHFSCGAQLAQVKILIDLRALNFTYCSPK